MPSITTDRPREDLRQQSIERLEARSGFWSHLSTYLVVSGLIITVWVVVADGGMFWPIFPMLGWGVGLLFHAVATFRRPYSEDRIEQEMDRMR